MSVNQNWKRDKRRESVNVIPSRLVSVLNKSIVEPGKVSIPNQQRNYCLLNRDPRTSICDISAPRKVKIKKCVTETNTPSKDLVAKFPLKSSLEKTPQVQSVLTEHGSTRQSKPRESDINPTRIVNTHLNEAQRTINTSVIPSKMSLKPVEEFVPMPEKFKRNSSGKPRSDVSPNKRPLIITNKSVVKNTLTFNKRNKSQTIPLNSKPTSYYSPEPEKYPDSDSHPGKRKVSIQQQSPTSLKRKLTDDSINDVVEPKPQPTTDSSSNIISTLLYENEELSGINNEVLNAGAPMNKNKSYSKTDRPSNYPSEGVPLMSASEKSPQVQYLITLHDSTSESYESDDNASRTHYKSVYLAKDNTDTSLRLSNMSLTTSENSVSTGGRVGSPPNTLEEISQDDNPDKRVSITTSKIVPSSTPTFEKSYKGQQTITKIGKPNSYSSPLREKGTPVSNSEPDQATVSSQHHIRTSLKQKLSNWLNDLIQPLQQSSTEASPRRDNTTAQHNFGKSVSQSKMGEMIRSKPKTSEKTSLDVNPDEKTLITTNQSVARNTPSFKKNDVENRLVAVIRKPNSNPNPLSVKDNHVPESEFNKTKVFSQRDAPTSPKQKLTHDSTNDLVQSIEADPTKSERSPRKKHHKKDLHHLSKLPKIEIIAEGKICKKPIKEKPPAPTMKGVDLTGTIRISTNKLQGVCNFYIEPKLAEHIFTSIGQTLNSQENRRKKLDNV